MAGKVKGITVEIGGDTNGLTKALSKVKKEINSTQNELKAVDRLLKLDPKNTELLAQKQQLLAKQTGTVKDKLEGLRKAKKQCDDDMKNGTEVNQRQYRELQREIAETEQKLKELTVQSSKFTAAGEKISAVGNKMTDIGKKGMAASAAVVGLGTVCIKNASDMEESMNKVDVAFKDNADTVKKWSDTTLERYGISKGSALEMSSLFGDMGTAMGIPTDKAADMSMSLVGLAGDLSSFKNVSQEVAQNALKGIFTGEGESLKLLGVIMQDATLQEYALANGCKKKYSEMTQTEKVQLRYNYVMEQTKNAQDDFSRTSDGTANSTRIFTESLKQLSAEIGEKLIPIITPIIQKLTEFVQWFSQLSDGQQKVIVVIGIIVAILPPLLILLGSLITSVGTITAAWGKLNLVMSANPIGIVITVIVALVAAFVVLWKKCDGFRNFWINLWDKIKNAAITAINFVMENWKEIGLFIVNPIAGAIALLYKLNPKFKAWVDKIILFFKELPKNLLQIGKDLVKGLWNGINDKVEWLKGKVKGVVDKIKSWFTNKDGLDEHSPSKWAKQVGEFLMEGLANGITEDMSAEDALKKKLDNIKNFIDENISSIRNDISQKRSSFADTLNNGSLYDTTTFTLGDNSVKKISFHDFTKDTQANLEWASLLTEFENRLNAVSNDNDLNYTLMQMIRDMGMTDGTQFINMAMQSNDSKFRDFVEGWQAYRKSAEIAAAQTYSREAEQLQTGFLSEVENGLTSITDSFKSSGENSAEAFKAGFMDKIKSVMTQIQSIMQNYNTSFNLSGIVPTSAGNSSTVTNNSTKNFSVNITNGSNVSPFEQRQQINRLFDKMQLQEEL